MSFVSARARPIVRTNKPKRINAGIGTAGEALSVDTLWGSTGGDGVGRPVSVNFTGKINTYGDGATGIWAQSAGGLAGLTADGADVAVSVDGTVQAFGTDASAIFVQSMRLTPGSGGGDPVQVGAGSSHVSISAGSLVQGGAGGTVQTGAGVEFRDGISNTLDNAGTITSLGPVAVAHSGDGTVAINNSGTIAGDILMTGAVTNTGLISGSFAGPMNVMNARAGRIDTGADNPMGHGGVIRNEGIMNVRGDGLVGTTHFDASLEQGSTGTIAIDLKLPRGQLETADADLLTLSGSAELSGGIDVRLVDAGQGGGGRQSVNVISAAGGLSAAELSVKPSAIAQFQLERTDSTVAVSYDLDFLNDSLEGKLSENQREIASHFAALHDAGGVQEGHLYLAEAEDAAAYALALDALSPVSYGINASATLLSSVAFSDSLMSCNERDGADRFIRESRCIRLDVGGRHLSRDGTSEGSGYDLTFGGVTVGGQVEVREGWLLGLGLGYERVFGSSDDGLWDSDGNQYQMGFVVKRQFGSALFAASLSGGFGEVDVERDAAPGLTALGTQKFQFVSSQFRAAYAFEFDDWYLQPTFDANVTYLNTGDLTESGGGAANLRVHGSDDVYVAISPAIEAGFEIEAAHDLLVRPRAAIGVTQFLSDPSQTVTAGFTGAGGAITPFTVTNDMDRTSLDVRLGLEVLSARGMNLSVGGVAQIGENTLNLSGGLRLSIPF